MAILIKTIQIVKKIICYIHALGYNLEVDLGFRNFKYKFLTGGRDVRRWLMLIESRAENQAFIVYTSKYMFILFKNSTIS